MKRFSALRKNNLADLINFKANNNIVARLPVALLAGLGNPINTTTMDTRIAPRNDVIKDLSMVTKLKTELSHDRR